MVYKTKRDIPVTLMIVFLILLIQADAIVPFVLGNVRVSGWIIFALLTLLNVLIIWSFIDLKYVLKEHHLIIKAGLIKHQIPYVKIEKVVQKKKLWSGFRLIGSRHAITIYYQGGWGHAVISPQNTEEFIHELEEKNSNITTFRKSN
ncbi:PH domain-containing protein [Bacillus inaquosorum]|uniref:PH domain-containing protein n=1 Tax=Bacillus inaquosorum TaxID=483913 RepID=UPI002280C204|nr:PH domain-containing protein [Bacillus inaquosorum]MCY7786525.1 PH domain-containing protein [Bacillus inaquosorum]MCY7820694.1 PH domain-containing protein [Bacillus inaquosorum]MCY7936441.1 PH domain-containing protein [Bacillus inaquosorum]MCY9385306.1 PH domain-containing protein [Bacillus inaquosorum]MEC0536199.1 PH domain-containing protein [Bacillus inaquosorum]